MLSLHTLTIDSMALVQVRDVSETTLDVESTYANFDELWSGFLAGIGPAGSYCVNLDESQRATLRNVLFRRLGSPSGAFQMRAKARCAHGYAPRP